MFYFPPFSPPPRGLEKKVTAPDRPSPPSNGDTEQGHDKPGPAFLPRVPPRGTSRACGPEGDKKKGEDGGGWLAVEVGMIWGGGNDVVS